MRLYRIPLFLSLTLILFQTSYGNSFENPPLSSKPWVIWHWINGNVSREGITKDLEALHAAGVGGVIQMEVSGAQWAPAGPVAAHSKESHELIQWAISESARIGVDFDLTIDYGYGSGGSHIDPTNSMQQLVWSDTVINGGGPVSVKLDRPSFSPEEALKDARLREGESIDPKVLKAIESIDSYRDVAVIAFPQHTTKTGRDYRIPEIEDYNGLHWKTHLKPFKGLNIPREAIIPFAKIYDLSSKMDTKGNLNWDAPPGDWIVMRIGHASNFKLTRPSPAAAVGLECDRLSPAGIEAHFEYFLEPIFKRAGSHTGNTFKYMFLDSWEAHGQIWTSGFEKEFEKRLGYDILPWIPVLTGRVLGSVEKSERFLADMRKVVSDVMLDNYVDRLMELARPYGILFSNEPYGRVCVDSLTWGGRVDFPICEFWTQRNHDLIPDIEARWYPSMKALASVANTYGKQWVGAEAFTGARGWMDHPYPLKKMGDESFCNGVNKFTIHSSSHQAYDWMKPGFNHRKWSQNFSRHQTWWPLSEAYFEYIARCQYMLQKGRRVTDVACLFLDGAPIHFEEVNFSLPHGYDFDLCSAEIIQRMEVRDGRIHLPTGVSYSYLALPANGKLSWETARKIDQLFDSGANIVTQSTILGTPGLKGFPDESKSVNQMAKAWDPARKLDHGWDVLFEKEKLSPDFIGEGLNYTHRRTSGEDIYFVASPNGSTCERVCEFRVTGMQPELWDPETGKKYRLSSTETENGRTRIHLKFEPHQSWFVVFRKNGPDAELPYVDWSVPEKLIDISGPWNVRFDPEWGGPEGSVDLDELVDWSQHEDERIRYFSGTAVYNKTFSLSETGNGQLMLDLGDVEVMARVKLNGKDCGIAWKPPYQLDISHAARIGKNHLEVEIVNTWVNRLVGDEQLPLEGEWKPDNTMKLYAEYLVQWPKWFPHKEKRTSGRYTFTASRHYNMDTPLHPAGLIGPVSILQKESSLVEADRN